MVAGDQLITNIFCVFHLGNQGDPNFWTGLKKYVITALLYLEQLETSLHVLKDIYEIKMDVSAEWTHH